MKYKVGDKLLRPHDKVPVVTIVHIDDNRYYLINRNGDKLVKDIRTLDSYDLRIQSKLEKALA